MTAVEARFAAATYGDGRDRVDGVTARVGDARISVVIPTKNEAGNIGWVLARLPSIVDEVILVDGRSTDGTVEEALRARPDLVVVHERRPGKGAALRAGVEAATGDHIVMVDADGSMDPVEIQRYLAPLRDGCDLVKGSRFLPGAGTDDMTPLRQLGNRVLLALANGLFWSSSTDLCYGFAAFRREAFLDLELTADGFEIEAQLFLRARRAGLEVVEVPSFESPRRVGNSKLNTFRDGWRVLRTILVERLRPPVAARRSRSLAPLTVGFPTLLGEVSTVTVPSTTTTLIESVLHHSAEPSLATPVEVFIAPRPDGEAA